MMTKVVQIKGTNGSGKTTIAKQLVELGTKIETLKVDNRIRVTFLHNLQWACIGEYKPDSKMGGCDKLKSVAEVKEAIWLSLSLHPDYWVLFEGMMISTIKATFYDYLLELEKEQGIEPVFVILETNVDSCVKRIQSRGTMKADLQSDNIQAKLVKIIRNAHEYPQHYVRYMNVDEIPLDDMLVRFLELVDDKELLRQL